MNRGFVLSLILASAVAAQSTDPYEAKIRNLAHARFAEREKAARELEEAGEPTLKSLRAASNSTDAELRRRAETIVSRIERTQLSRKLLVAPQLHLKFDKVPLLLAINEVASKTGLRIQMEAKDAGPQRTITLDTGAIPFWQAVQAFYDAAGLVENDAPPSGVSPPTDGRRIQGDINGRRMYSAGQSENLVRVTSGKGTLPGELSHALRVRVVSPAYPLSKYNPATGEVKFHLDVDAAKGIEVREIVGVEVRRAIAKDQRELANAFPVPALQPNYFGEQMLMQQVLIVNGELLMDDGRPSEPFIPVTLKTGGIRPEVLSEFHGVVVARIVAPPEPMVPLQDVFQSMGQSQTRDGLTLTLKSSEEGTSNLATLRVQVKSTGESINELLNFPVQVKGRAQPFIRINRGGTIGTATELQARDADGKPVKIVATRIMASNSDGVTMTQDVEIKIEKPTSGLKNMNLSLNGRRPAVVEMPFVLRDVPLR